MRPIIESADQWADVRAPLPEGAGYEIGDDVKRDWTRARAKVDREGVCRLRPAGGCDGPLEAAHTIDKATDETPIVQPYDVVPLCKLHHARYDARRVSILEYLTLEEQGAAVQKIGLTRALRRLTSGQTEAVERVG